MRNNTKKLLLKEHFESFGCITTKEMFDLYAITGNKRIVDLRREFGMDIRHIQIQGSDNELHSVYYLKGATIK